MEEHTPPIAIIGMSCRLPGAHSPKALWQLLLEGKDAIDLIPVTRWDNQNFFSPNPGTTGKSYVRHMGSVGDVRGFDAGFFGISGREISCMDPQQRLLLEGTWEALEDSGIAPEHLAGQAVGVFVGISANEYGTMQYMDPHRVNAYTNSGNALSIAANRLSYIFDFRGPSLAIDTACSSSLVAVHEARHSILRGESTLAVVAGVNILLRPEAFVGFSAASMLSQVGQCRSFDSDADGYVRSEGMGVLILKPLKESLKDGDPIRALIVGSGVNSDGRTQGLALPSREGQSELLRRVYEEANIDPAEVDFVEAHGTGTLVGDPVECGSLGEVIGKAPGRSRPLRIGSIKSNIGHTEPASGVAGVLKAVLALQNRCLPPSIHCNSPNPEIPFSDLGLMVQTETEYLKETRPLLFGVNSFGFGGTNAHIVLREHCPASVATSPSQEMGRPPAAEDPPQIFPISARGKDALKAMAAVYGNYLDQARDEDWRRILHTAGSRRTHHSHRLAVVAQNRKQAALHLRDFVAGREASPVVTGVASAGEDRRIAFVFCGNGPQWWAMGRELLRTSASFRSAIEDCDALMRKQFDRSLIDEFTCKESKSRIHQTEMAQPALFALQVGLVNVLRDHGIVPHAAIGHSLGEAVAAYACDMLDLEDAFRIVGARSDAQATTAGAGKMAAIDLSAAEIKDLLTLYDNKIELAAVNARDSVTVSGQTEAIKQLVESLSAREVFARVLNLDYAFHSRLMDPLRQMFLKGIQGLYPHGGTCRLISTVTGDEVCGQDLGEEHWWHNMRAPVRFADAVERLVADGYRTFIEIGPHPVLLGYVRRSLAAQEEKTVVIPTLRRKEPELPTFLNAVGTLYVHGIEIDWNRFLPAAGAPIELPPYPWQREIHWSEAADGAQVFVHTPPHRLLGHALSSVERTWRLDLSLDAHPSFKGHMVQGSHIFPAAGYASIAVAAGREAFEDWPCSLIGLEIRRALILPEGRAVEIQTTLSSEDQTVRIFSRVKGSDKEWTLCAVTRLSPLESRTRPVINLDEVRQRCPFPRTVEEHYASCRDIGLEYGAAYQGIDSIWSGDDEALGRIIRRGVDGDTDIYPGIDPATLDGCMQVAMGCRSLSSDPKLYLPTRIERLRLHGPIGTDVYCHCRLRKNTDELIRVDFRLTNADGIVLAELDDFRFDRAPEAITGSPVPSMHIFEWRLADPVGGTPKNRSADFVPPPTALVERNRDELEVLPERFGREAYYGDWHRRCSQLCRLFVALAFQRIGRPLSQGERFRIADLAEGASIRGHYVRFIRLLLRHIEAAGFAVMDGDQCQIRKTLPTGDPWPLWRSIVEDYPAYIAEAVMLMRCGHYLADTLQDKVDPLQVIFSDNEMGILEHFYDSSPSCRVYNAIIRTLMADVCRQLPDGRTLRILEVGGGVGGTTAHILPLLPPEQSEYVFTDITEVFLIRARQRFARYPFFSAQILDISRDPAAQGFEGRDFDIIIGSLVLHVTPDLRETLHNLRQLLVPGGVLGITETHPDLIVDLAFGLLKDWWNFTDTDLRTEGPLLNPAEWDRLLQKEGFDAVAGVADCALDDQPQQSIWLARKPLDIAGVPSAKVTAKVMTYCVTLLGENALGSKAANLMERRGAKVIRVIRGDRGLETLDAGQFRVDPEDEQALVLLFDQIAGTADGHATKVNIINFWGMDTIEPDGATADDLITSQAHGSLALVNLVKALDSVQRLDWRVWMVTEKAQPYRLGSPVGGLSQTPIWGVGRVLMNEHPELRPVLIDLQPLGDGTDELNGLVNEIFAGGDEEEILLRGQNRYVHRLVPVEKSTQLAPQADFVNDTPEPFQLEVGTRGKLETLYLAEMPMAEPNADEVRVRVACTGLNFRDVLWALGMLPPEAMEGGLAGPTLGLECAGTVDAVGDDVDGISLGDRVLTLAKGGFASHVVVNADFVAPIPENMGFAEAATLPSVYFTAHYALRYLANLRSAERVLIHGGAGGVGMAAIRIARHLGAHVYATAGTTEKRHFLRCLGVDEAFDSRSLEFADRILETTDGEGVDVVLNSLAGEAMLRSVDLLRPFGRFLEIGKLDFYQNKKLGLRPLRHNVSYFGVDVDQLMRVRPDLARNLLTEVLEEVARGVYTTLPHRVFPVSRAAEGFRCMQQSKQIGKVVVSFDGDELPPVTKNSGKVRFRKDGTYLVIGGLGGFGLRVGLWLAEGGAGHIVLTGLRGKDKPGIHDAIEEMRQAGAVVEAAAVDATDHGQMTALLARIRQNMPPLRGVFHLAMVIDDGIILRLDRESMLRVMTPKMAGAWILHRQTMDDPIEHFVMFSSAATVLGHAGQANYVAANMFLEALAHHRRSLGLPALTIAWGAIGEVGYLARNVQLREKFLDGNPSLLIPVAKAIAAMEWLMSREAVEVGAAETDWGRFAQSAPAGNSARYEMFRVTAPAKQKHLGDREAFVAAFKAAPAEERQAVVLEHLRGRLAAVLGVPAEKIDPQRGLNQIGLDSLMAVELRIAIEHLMGIDLPVMGLMQGENLVELAARILSNLDGDYEEIHQIRQVSTSTCKMEKIATNGDDEDHVSDSWPLSYRQEYLWHLEHRVNTGTAYHHAVCIGVRPRLEIESLRQGLERLTHRHPILRAAYPAENGKPVTLIADEHPKGLEIIDCSDMEMEAVETMLQDHALETLSLGRGPLCRFRLYHCAGGEDILMLNFNHIIIDGWSSQLLLEEMFTSYFAIRNRVDPVLPDLSGDYGEFTRWQREMVQSPEGRAHRAYWLGKLSGLSSTYELPIDGNRPEVETFRGAAERFVLPGDMAAAVSQLARQTGTTRYAVLLSVFKLLLYRRSGRDDVLVFTSVAARTAPRFDDLLGLIANLVFIRNRIPAKGSFDQFLVQVHRTIGEALDHQDYPHAALLNDLGIRNDLSKHPLTTVGFSMERPSSRVTQSIAKLMYGEGDALIRIAGYEARSITLPRNRAICDLNMIVDVFEDRLVGILDYNVDLFETQTIREMAKEYQELLKTVLAKPSCSLAKLKKL